MAAQHRTTADEAETGPVPSTEEMPSPSRMEAFSDGVFSVIITLLVLYLQVPPPESLPGHDLGAALLHQSPTYAAFVLSFLQVGVVWSHHHTMFHYIRRTDHLLLIFNLLLLMCVAVVPFTTALLSAYVRGTPSERRLAALAYSGALVLAGVCFNVTWRHARRARLVTPTADPHRLAALERHWLLVPLVYGVSFLVAFVSVNASLALYALLLLYYALPGPVAVRWMTALGTRRAARGHARAT